MIGAGEYAAAAARLRSREEELRRQWQAAVKTDPGPGPAWLEQRVTRLLALEQPDRPLLGQLIRGIYVQEGGQMELRLAFARPEPEKESVSGL